MSTPWPGGGDCANAAAVLASQKAAAINPNRSGVFVECCDMAAPSRKREIDRDARHCWRRQLIGRISSEGPHLFSGALCCRVPYLLSQGRSSNWSYPPMWRGPYEPSGRVLAGTTRGLCALCAASTGDLRVACSLACPARRRGRFVFVGLALDGDRYTLANQTYAKMV